MRNGCTRERVFGLKGGGVAEDSHNGVILFHLIVSFTIAFTYGKFGRSSDFGSQSALTTRSISSCAFFCTEGLSIIARKNVRVVEMVFLTHASVGRSMFIIVDCDRPYLFQQDIARPPNI